MTMTLVDDLYRPHLYAADHPYGRLRRCPSRCTQYTTHPRCPECRTPTVRIGDRWKRRQTKPLPGPLETKDGPGPSPGG